MQSQLYFYNSLSRKKELFQPLNPPFVGMYVCGPTVYGDAHLGHARAYTTFDVVNRYLTYLGYKVRYVRNITDVGHLENDADFGEDKIAKKAKLEKLEPMEVVQQYTNSFRKDMELLNILAPSIEPTATGHIIEQLEMIKTILDNGFAYESEGSVYFDVLKYNQKHQYGVLSGRNIEEMISGTRELDGQESKRNSLDFALWKKANPEHIMRWRSPWGEGFPGWHLECSAMSTKYLGETFDIHGGGMDLMFPHHEGEIAQSMACNHCNPVKYWLHNNFITLDGQKMSKSKGNFITLQQLFAGEHKVLEQAYTPMNIRFFILQTHYRSTLDFSNEALKASKKGYFKLMNGLKIAKNLVYAKDESVVIDEKQNQQITQLTDSIFAALNDDLNTAKTIASLFDLLKKINSIYTGSLKIASLSEETFNKMKETYSVVLEKILGLKEEKPETETLMKHWLEEYKLAKSEKNYAKVDQIRAYFKEMGLVLKDMKDKIDWAYDEV